MDFLQKSSGEFKVWKLRKFTVTFFCQKFRENNVFTKENTNELLRRNFSWVTVNLSFFHTVTVGKILMTFFRGNVFNQ